MKVFLIGDAVTCAVAGQKVPDGYDHLDRMITSAGRHDGEVGCRSLYAVTQWTAERSE